MKENFVETQDSSGRTVVEMNDHALGILSICALICASPMLVLGVLRGLLWGVLGFAICAVLYVLTRKHLRLVIDPGRRVLTIGRRIIPLDQIVRAELGVERRSRESGPGGGPLLFYRVELLLRSGERVPTIRGHGQFNPEDCHRLMDLINAAVDVR
jgi:hypothetical protein